MKGLLDDMRASWLSEHWSPAEPAPCPMGERNQPPPLCSASSIPAPERLAINTFFGVPAPRDEYRYPLRGAQSGRPPRVERGLSPTDRSGIAVARTGADVRDIPPGAAIISQQCCSLRIEIQTAAAPWHGAVRPLRRLSGESIPVRRNMIDSATGAGLVVLAG